MTFLAAGWLALLLPWAALVAWSWRRVAQERATTAAFLWSEHGVELPRSNARRGPPPPWIMAALLATLAMILALASPARRGRAARVAIVVDGSVALAARVGERTQRDELVDRCEAEIAASGARVTATIKLAGVADVSPDTLDDVRHLPFTARPTDEAIARALKDFADEDAIIVMTDKPMTPSSDRVVMLEPGGGGDNLGLVSAVAVQTPRPSIMVRIANDSDRQRATLVVRGRGGELSESNSAHAGPAAGLLAPKRVVELPARGGMANVFVDLAAPPDEIEVALVGLNDALAIDDSALLLRHRATPRLIAESGTPEIATRFAAAYDRSHRVEQSGGDDIRLCRTAAMQGASVVFAAGTLPAAGPLRFVEHPLFRDANVQTIRVDRIASPAPEGWTPVAFAGATPIVAVRNGSPRAVWIGFELDPNDARSVVLLANAIDWIADGGPGEWQGRSPADIGEDWRATSLVDPRVEASPGRYLDNAGRPVAVNLPAMVGPHGQSRGDIINLLRTADRSAFIALDKPIAIAAGLFALTSAWLFGKRRAA